MAYRNGLSQNEISHNGKVVAGICLILFILFPIWLIMAYWPNSIPKPGIKPLYIKELYHVRLACIPESECCIDTVWVKNRIFDSVKVKIDTIIKVTDTINKLNADSLYNKNQKNFQWHYYTKSDLIDLNSLILILIAAAGFLGNMIHIATSFTTFVGNNQFKRSWILWYCVKPFTAAGLALGLYFVFRGGFLNYNVDAVNINLYGILTISVLAGLFTDKATLKLGEIFEVVFSVKSGDKRTDKLQDISVDILSASPDKLVRGIVNAVIITGNNLDKAKLIYKINDEEVAADKITITSKTVTILYTISERQAGQPKLKMEILDTDKNELFVKVFDVE